MLTERGQWTRDERGRIRRRFADPEFDLTVLIEPDGSMFGFELRYRRDSKLWLLTWAPVEQYLSYQLAAGPGGAAELRPTDPGKVDGSGLLKRLKSVAAFIEPRVRSFVLELLYSLADEARRCRYCARRNRSEWHCARCWLRACPACMERKALRKSRCTWTEASHEWKAELAILGVL